MADSAETVNIYCCKLTSKCPSRQSAQDPKREKMSSEMEEAPPHKVLTLLTQIRSKEAITPILGIYGFMGFRGKNREERTGEWSG